MDFNRLGDSNRLGTGRANVLSPTAPFVESASPIRDRVTETEQLLSDLRDAISALEKRLDTALKPVPPSAVQANVATPTPITSHLAGRLVILNEGFMAAAHRLSDVISRIEI